MTRAQIAILKFFETTILGGSLPFTFNDPTGRYDPGQVRQGQPAVLAADRGGVYRVNISPGWCCHEGALPQLPEALFGAGIRRGADLPADDHAR
jgi:hypothetical protein